MNPQLLKNGLYVNAIVSGLLGLVLAIAPGVAGSLLMPALPLWAVAAIGIALAVFALDVGWVAATRSNSAFFVGAIFVADVAWVIGVPAMLMVAPSVFTPLGIAAALASTIAVAAFAVIEWQGLKMIGERHRAA